ncbi:MAG: NUDIX hydrolase [Alphaproteobacteria bacterium]|nr:NUDIX hydrolase [Alphaproteobacteria bacterium]
MNKKSPFDEDNQTIVQHVLRPKDAGTLILTRKEGGETRLLMGRRHEGMAFMAGKYVFPGGRVDLADYRVPAGGELAPDVLAKVSRGIPPARARAVALAAVRETFEETGVLVGERTDKTPRTRAGHWAKFFAHGVVPKLDALQFVARAITPPNRTRRFDARFFWADASAIAHMLDAHENTELLTPCWVTFAEARALDLPSITRTVIDEIEARLSEGAARPVPFFRFRRNKPSIEYL